jgi:hypothetical protein
MTPPSQNEVTQLLLAWSDGDKAALEELTPLVYAELRRLAERYCAASAQAIPCKPPRWSTKPMCG